MKSLQFVFVLPGLSLQLSLQQPDGTEITFVITETLGLILQSVTEQPVCEKL